MTTELEIEGTGDLAAGIDGWLSLSEGRFLHDMARRCRRDRGCIVEIGSWKGRSTVWLAKGTKMGDGARVYAIDPHTGSSEHRESLGEGLWTFDEFRDNIRAAGVEDVVAPIVLPSTEAVRTWNEPIEFLFIDGDHSYEAVREDMISWLPHLVPGGCIALHDSTAAAARLDGWFYGWPGPRRAARELIFRSRRFHRVGFVDTITYVIKCDDCGAREVFNKLGVEIRKIPYDVLMSFGWVRERIRVKRKHLRKSKRAWRRKLRGILERKR